MRTKMSVFIIVLTVITVGFTAVPVKGGTNETRKARRDRRIKARASIEAPVNQQLPCYGEPIDEGRGLGIGRGNWMGGPGAGRGRGQGLGVGINQGRGAGRGNRMVGPGAGRGRGYGRNFALRNQGGSR